MLVDFTKLGVCIDIVEIWFENSDGRISSIFGSYLPATRPLLFPYDNLSNLSKCQWIFTKLGMCIDIVEIWLGITCTSDAVYTDWS